MNDKIEDKKKGCWFVKHLPEKINPDEQSKLIVSEEYLANKSFTNQDPEKLISIRYARSLEEGNLSPFDELSLFTYCMKAGIYPPLSLLWKMSDNFEKFIDSVKAGEINRKKLDELFKVDIIAPIKNEIKEKRDITIAGAVFLLMEYYGLKRPSAVDIVVDLFNQPEYKEEKSMNNIKVSLTAGRITNIFEENKSWWKNLLIDKPALNEAFLNQFPIMKLKDHSNEFSPDIRHKINARWKAEMSSS